MTSFGKTNYAQATTPPGYKCTCGATNCKLWREYQTFLNHQTLACAPCAAKEQQKDISTLNEKGLRQSDTGLTDNIGWRIPAVPTEEGDTFWGYTSVPLDGVIWWQNLPTLPSVKKQCSE
ncbi:MAG: hypothetical protein PHF86_05075 [Candidatus Nanoarchaeia archaeon]|nr:hypothetical protein [Candidatus Nanoarchaeia archaeon]